MSRATQIDMAVVRSLRARGCTYGKIAETIGVPIGTLTAYVSRLNKREGNEARPYTSAPKPQTAPPRQAKDHRGLHAAGAYQEALPDGLPHRGQRPRGHHQAEGQYHVGN